MKTLEISSPKHILLPTDFSSCAKNACIYAASLLRSGTTEFILLNTFESAGSDHEEYARISRGSRRTIEA